jgi:DNA-binding transcriptional regulator YiaG
VNLLADLAPTAGGASVSLVPGLNLQLLVVIVRVPAGLSARRDQRPNARPFTVQDDDTPARPANQTPDPAAVNRLRTLIAQGKLSQRAAARELGVDERTFRYWCSGDYPPPPMAFRALDPGVRHRENLRRTIRDNEQQIEMLDSGKLTMGFGPELGTAKDAAAHAHRLRQRNQELRSILRQEEAFERRQQAFFAVHQQWLPHGNGLPSEESIAEFDAAEKEWRDAHQEAEQIVKEIRDGLPQSR